jgi:hypothetical protein
MRKIAILGFVSLMILTLQPRRAFASGVGAIPVAIALAIYEGVANAFTCHPHREKLELVLDSVEVDGIASSPSQSGEGFFVGSNGDGQVIAALADPTSDAAGAARADALVVPELR